MTIAILRAGLVCAALLAGPSSYGGEALEPAVASASRGVVIGTGSVSGVYYQAGNAICRLVERDKRADRPDEPALPCGAMMTGGSFRNVAALLNGSVEAALVQSDVLDQAVRGAGPFQGRANDRLRALFSLHGEPYQVVALRGLGLRGFGDLKGRKVDLGRSGTAANATFATLMRRYDLGEGAFSQVHHLAESEQVAAFCDGDVEAFGRSVGAPHAGLAHAISRCGGDLLDLDSQTERKLVADTSGYAPVVIPRGTYPSVDRDVRTFGVVAVAVVSAELPDEVAYRMVRAIFEHVDDLRAMHPALSALDAERMVTDGITAPLHAGAVRYFRERGLLRRPSEPPQTGSDEGPSP